MRMWRGIVCGVGLCALVAMTSGCATPKLKALIIDGQNNHNWAGTSPVLKQMLVDSGRFTVDVATSPAKGEDMSGYRPRFADYDVVVSNYNGDAWPAETQKDLERYMENGGGLVIYHASDNPFPDWVAYNEMIGLGGWGSRSEKDGPYIRWREGEIVRDMTPGPGGSHGHQCEFTVDAREPNHPIMKGLPAKWLHVKDELYNRLRGPAKNLTVLATGYSDPETKGTGEHEPVLMTIRYGKGRVFHTVIGHNIEQIEDVGFQVTFLRGTEWAATGRVTLTEIPADFPTADQTSTRHVEVQP